MLKRKSFAVYERDEDGAASTSSVYSPRKRLRAEEPSSINEACRIHPQTACGAVNSEDGQVVDETQEDEGESEKMEELRAKLKEYEEAIARVKKESEQDVATIQKLKEETMVCMVCRDLIQNPQILECGHSACYSCLRSWWTRPLQENDEPEVIDTDAESDLEDEITEPKRKGVDPFVEPQLRTRAIIDTLNGDLLPLPAHIRAKRQARLARREDIWHGIFWPEHELVEGPVVPPLPHPDPVRNRIAQAQYQKAVKEVGARKVRAREGAFQNGRRMGFVETTKQLERKGPRGVTSIRSP